MASKMSDKETEKFIDAFEERDCLWRTTSPEYCDRNVPHIHQNEHDCKSTAAPNTIAPVAAFYVSLLL